MTCCLCYDPVDRKRRSMKISAPISIREAPYESVFGDSMRYKYVSVMTTTDPSVMGEEREIELQLVSHRLLTMVFPDDGSDLSYKRSLKDVSEMLDRQYHDNYQIVNLSERRIDLTKLNPRVVEFGLPLHLVPSVTLLMSACRHLLRWLETSGHHVAVFHCKGDLARLSAFVAAFMYFCSVHARSSEALMEEKKALKSLYDGQLSAHCGPSHRRYLQYFTAVLSASMRDSSRVLHLHAVTLTGLGKLFNAQAKHGRLFLKIYSNMRLSHTSPVYTINSSLEKVRFPIEPVLVLSGDVLLKCFFKRTQTARRETLFSVQFNTAFVQQERLYFFKQELDVACCNAKFPNSGRVDLLFKENPAVMKEFDKSVSAGRIGVDRTIDPLIRWDSYDDFHQSNTSFDHIDSAGRVHGPMNQQHSARLGAIQHTAGPVDGSPYAEVVRDTTISTAGPRVSSTRHSSPGNAWNVSSHDSGFSSSTPGSAQARQPAAPSSSAGLTANDARELDRLLEELRVAGETALTTVKRTQSTRTAPSVRTDSQPTFRTSITRVHTDQPRDGYESEPEGSSSYFRRAQFVESATERELRLLEELKNAQAELVSLRRQQQRSDDLFDINLRYSALHGGRRRHRSQQEEGLYDAPRLPSTRTAETVHANGLPPPPSYAQTLANHSLHNGHLHHLCHHGHHLDQHDHHGHHEAGDTKLAELERSLQAASDKISRERFHSGYSAHRENLRASQTHLAAAKKEDPEFYEEIETVTLQPIGKGVHDLETTGSHVSVPRTVSVSGGQKAAVTQSMDRIHQMGGHQMWGGFNTSSVESREEHQRAKTPQPRANGLHPSYRRRHLSHEYVSATDAVPSFEITPADASPQSARIPVHSVPISVGNPRSHTTQHQASLHQQTQHQASLHHQQQQLHLLQQQQQQLQQQHQQLQQLQQQQHMIQQQQQLQQQQIHQQQHNQASQLPQVSQQVSQQHQQVVQQPQVSQQHQQVSPQVIQQPPMNNHSQSGTFSVTQQHAATLEQSSPASSTALHSQVKQLHQPAANSLHGLWSTLELGSESVVNTPKLVRDSSKLWYKPSISRDEAIRMLKDKPPGAFMVRDSNSFPGAFGLALKVAHLPQGVTPKSDDVDSELVRHFLIEPTSKGVRLKGCSNEPVFGSLTALIYQHTLTALALPCRLVVPLSDAPGRSEVDGAKSPPLASPGSISEQWPLLFLGTVEVESLTGSNAIVRSVDILLDEMNPGRQTTECQLKISADGVTLTDTQRKLFFRRHYQPNAISFCGIDPKGRCWSGPEVRARQLQSARIFGLITRKQGAQTSATMDNVCHVLSELQPGQSSLAVVNTLNRYLNR